jgi:hypothetical protein
LNQVVVAAISLSGLFSELDSSRDVLIKVAIDDVEGIGFSKAMGGVGAAMGLIGSVIATTGGLTACIKVAGSNKVDLSDGCLRQGRMDQQRVLGMVYVLTLRTWRMVVHSIMLVGYTASNQKHNNS